MYILSLLDESSEGRSWLGQPACQHGKILVDTFSTKLRHINVSIHLILAKLQLPKLAFLTNRPILDYNKWHHLLINNEELVPLWRQALALVGQAVAVDEDGLDHPRLEPAPVPVGGKHATWNMRTLVSIPTHVKRSRLGKVLFLET